MSQPPPTCWPIQHTQPACGVASHFGVEQDSRVCYYGTRVKDAVGLAAPADISGETELDCEEGYSHNMVNTCTLSGSRYEGCGSVPLNHLWNGHSFLTVSRDHPMSSAQARNVLSLQVAVSVQLRSA